MAMSKREREQLLKLYELMGKIPFPHMGGGTQSATVIGYVGYAKDMREVYGYFQQTILAIILGKEWDGFTHANADTLLCALERWIDTRATQQWEAVSMDKMPYLESILSDIADERDAQQTGGAS